MSLPSLRDLMAAGAHFGHKRERSHPKAKQYIYTLREGIYIIDLQKTQEALEKALAVLTDLAKAGKTVLFVGTKPQASDLLKAAAEAAGMPYISHRWPGGLLTNFETVAQNLKQMTQLETRLADETVILTKKEKRVLSDKLGKMLATLGGVREMADLPDALFVVDVVGESTAVSEAYRLGIPVIGVCDTNANPEQIDYPIPANDDARKSIELIVNLVSEAMKNNKAVAPVAPVAPTESAQEEIKEEAKPAEPVAKPVETSAASVEDQPVQKEETATEVPAETLTETPTETQTETPVETPTPAKKKAVAKAKTAKEA